MTTAIDAKIGDSVEVGKEEYGLTTSNGQPAITMYVPTVNSNTGVPADLRTEITRLESYIAQHQATIVIFQAMLAKFTELGGTE